MTVRRAVVTSIPVSAALITLLTGCGAPKSGQTSAGSPSQSAPDGNLPHLVAVEVLNAGKAVGAARTVALLLRAARLDVVYYGGASAELSGQARSEILVRRGDTAGVGRIIATLGNLTVVDAPDRSRLVDLTVVLGKDFAPSSRGVRP